LFRFQKFCSDLAVVISALVFSRWILFVGLIGGEHGPWPCHSNAIRR